MGPVFMGKARPGMDAVSGTGAVDGNRTEHANPGEPTAKGIFLAISMNYRPNTDYELTSSFLPERLIFRQLPSIHAGPLVAGILSRTGRF